MLTHRAFRLLAIAMQIAVLPISLPAETIELDLGSALARAPEANFQILLSQEALASQEQASRIARAGLLPQVTLEAAQSRSMNPNVSSLSQSFPGIPKRFFDDRFDGVLRARLALLDFRAWDDWKISKLSLQATEFQIRNTIQEILQQIAITYLTQWRSESRLAVIDANLERDTLLLKIATDQREAGVATPLDVTRAEVRLANNELARLQEETRVLESALNLKRVLNIPLGTTVILTQKAPENNMAGLAFSSTRFEQILRQRTDYQQLLAEVEREELAVGASRRDRLPSVDLSGQWGYASEAWSDDMLEQWNIQLGVSIPIFEGFRIDAQQRIAASDLRQRELELADLRQEIESEYRLVLQTLTSTNRQVEVARRAVELNQREFELARIRFEEGVADNSDVVSAQATLADAEDALVEAQFQFFLAQINLARVEGDVRAVLR